MNRLKSAIISWIFPVLAVVAVACSYNQSGTTNYLCRQQYALCTSALCVPQPGNPSKAICFCSVEEGPSLATVHCDSIKPSTDKNGIRTVFSTFSFNQFEEGKKGMKCPSNTPWTWCLNKTCTVDPTNPKKAVCVCDVMRNTGEWMTLGGNCDTSTCATGYWSGATLQDNDQGNEFLVKALGLKESPAKWCQAAPR